MKVPLFVAEELRHKRHRENKDWLLVLYHEETQDVYWSSFVTEFALLDWLEENPVPGSFKSLIYYWDDEDEKWARSIALN